MSDNEPTAPHRRSGSNPDIFKGLEHDELPEDERARRAFQPAPRGPETMHDGTPVVLEVSGFIDFDAAQGAEEPHDAAHPPLTEGDLAQGTDPGAPAGHLVAEGEDGHDVLIEVVEDADDTLPPSPFPVSPSLVPNEGAARREAPPRTRRGAAKGAALFSVPPPPAPTTSATPSVPPPRLPSERPTAQGAAAAPPPPPPPRPNSPLPRPPAPAAAVRVEMRAPGTPAPAPTRSQMAVTAEAPAPQHELPEELGMGPLPKPPMPAAPLAPAPAAPVVSSRWMPPEERRTGTELAAPHPDALAMNSADDDPWHKLRTNRSMDDDGSFDSDPPPPPRNGWKIGGLAFAVLLVGALVVTGLQFWARMRGGEAAWPGGRIAEQYLKHQNEARQRNERAAAQRRANRNPNAGVPIWVRPTVVAQQPTAVPTVIPSAPPPVAPTPVAPPQQPTIVPVANNEPRCRSYGSFTGANGAIDPNMPHRLGYDQYFPNLRAEGCTSPGIECSLLCRAD